MINDEYKEFFEHMFTGFTKAVFANGRIPPMYMVIIGKEAEVIPAKTKDMPDKLYAAIVAQYAKVKEAQFIAHISHAIMIPNDAEENIPNPTNHPDAEEMLLCSIGDPRGELHAILGKVKKAIDGTLYVEHWWWAKEMEQMDINYIQSFTD